MSSRFNRLRGKNFPVEKDKKGRKRHMQLFSREIDSRDICQGAGNVRRQLETA